MTIQVELPDDFYEKLERQAKAEGRKVQELIMVAVDQYINKKQRRSAPAKPKY